jgi:hypothetical protein
MLRRKTGSWCAIGALLASLGLASAAQAQSAFISEVLFNPPSGDNGFEAIEITGTPGMSLDGWSFVVIDGDGTSSGMVTVVIPLDGQTIGSNGVFLIRDAATDLVPAPAAETTIFVPSPAPVMQNGSQTYVLGQGTPPTAGSDLDAENDGSIDAPIPSYTAVDAVSYTDGGPSDSQYADDFGFPAANLGNVNPQAIYRVLTTGNAPYSWAGGSITGTNPGPYNWSGANNFGWAAVGVMDPTQLSMDLGTLNFVFETTGTGACCFPNGSCQVMAANDCTAQGGAYQGDNSDCASVFCPQPMGACCFSDHSCSVTTQVICTAQGGEYQGDDTVCNPLPCPQAMGACCLGDGSCEMMGELDCAAAGGAFRGEGIPCDAIDCTPATPGALYLSELFYNSPGGDEGNESIEIVGPPNFSLDGWLFLVIEGDGLSTTGTGVVDQKVSLRGMSTGSNGILLIRDTGATIEPAPADGTNVVVFDFTPDIENGSNTFVLGYGRFDPTVGADIDANDDGTIDVPLGNFTPVDAVAYADPSNPPSLQYADDFGGENLGEVTPLPPGALYRILDPSLNPYSWAGGFTTGSAPGPFFWSATSNFGWAAVGIPDPSTRSLDLGTLNYVFTPAATGGCCAGDGTCTVVSEADCAAQGGTYQGDGTTCEAPCPASCPCDFNGDMVLNSQDFFDFLNCFFSNECVDADFNHDNLVNSQDFFDFLNCFFTPPNGCN